MLDNPWPLALKASMSAMLAYALCLALSLPDGLSAAFVAVVCVTPTVLAGLRRAAGTALGSVIGGGLTGLLMTLHVPTLASLGVSVGGAVMAVYALGFWRAHTVAAFTAIYMHVLPLGGPGQALSIRVAAIGVGALAAMTVNTLVSAMFYERIFARRAQRCSEAVAAGAEGIAAGKLMAMVPAFEVVNELASELAQARRELQWRKRASTAQDVERRRERLRALVRVAHFAHDLALVVGDKGEALTPEDVALLRHVAAHLRGEASDAPEAAGIIGARVLAALARYDRAGRGAAGANAE